MKTLPAAVLLSFAAALVAQSPGAAPAAPPKDALAKAWQRAVELSRKHKAPILAFVLPEAGASADEQVVAATRAAEKEVGMLIARRGSIAPAMKTQCDVLLRQVQLLRGSHRSAPGAPAPSDEQVVFALTVPVFARADACGAEPGENVVLLAPPGDKVAGLTLDLLDREAFLREVGGRVLARSALEPRAANVPVALGEQLKELTELQEDLWTSIGDKQWRARWERAEQLTEELAAQLVAVGPLLVRREGDGGEVEVAPALSDLETARAPLGTTAEVAAIDPCPGCGMGYTPPGLLTTLKLIGP